jgi:uncharacterized protein with HEPN domain
MDKKNSYELISYIKYSIYLIEERVGSISTSSDFLSDNIGVEKLDSISMRLQSIGEAIKNILKNDSTLLTQLIINIEKSLKS